MAEEILDIKAPDMNPKWLLRDYNDFKELAEAIPRCDKCNLDLPIGRTVGLEDDSKVWAVGYNPALRDIFRNIIKVSENGRVKHYYNKERYHEIDLDNAFFERLHQINSTLLQTKYPVVNEYGILEDYYYDYNDKIDKLFKKIPGCNLRVGRGIALTDLVKCFSLSMSKRRKDDKNKLNMNECVNNCISFLLNEISFKKPRLIFFTYFGAYDAFVKKVNELEFGKIKGHTSKRENLSILRCNDFFCYLIKGTTGDRWKSSGLQDYEKHKQSMIESISIALKSL